LYQIGKPWSAEAHCRQSWPASAEANVIICEKVIQLCLLKARRGKKRLRTNR
jgi:hypothetical protein